MQIDQSVNVSAKDKMSINNYIRIKVIGKGSYGEVWLGRHKEDKKLYVLKKMNLQKACQRERTAAEQEAKLLSQLRHPNIVAYKDSFETESGQLYISMQYCEGGDLYNVLKKRKGVLLEEKQIIEWFFQIMMALEYMHKRCILHRDLKTQNIFLTKTKLIKVGDLGIARVLESNSDMATTLIGTPYYMSPELFSNKPYNHKSDIWALGCCMYEMTTLKHAFNAKDMNSLVYKILRGKMPAMPTVYNKELTDMIKSMLSQVPEKRPSVSYLIRHPLIRRNIQIFLENTKAKHNLPSKQQVNQSCLPVSSIPSDNNNKSLAPSEPIEQNPPISAYNYSNGATQDDVNSKEIDVKGINDRHIKVDESPNTIISDIKCESKHVNVVEKPKDHNLLMEDNYMSHVCDNDNEELEYINFDSRHKNDQLNSHVNHSSQGEIVKTSEASQNVLECPKFVSADEDHVDVNFNSSQTNVDDENLENFQKQNYCEDSKKLSIQQNVHEYSVKPLIKEIQSLNNSVHKRQTRDKRKLRLEKNHDFVISERPLPPPPQLVEGQQNLPQNSVATAADESRSCYKDNNVKSSGSSSTSSSHDSEGVKDSVCSKISFKMSARERRRQQLASSCSNYSNRPKSAQRLKLVRPQARRSSDSSTRIKRSSDETLNKCKDPIENRCTADENDSIINEEKCGAGDKKEINDLLSILNTTLHLFRGDGDHIDIGKIASAARSETDNTNKSADRLNTITSTGRLYDRIHLLRRDCVMGIGEKTLQQAYDILEKFEDHKIEPMLIDLLGKAKFDEYAGKIWQLKFCEEYQCPANENLLVFS